MMEQRGRLPYRRSLLEAVLVGRSSKGKSSRCVGGRRLHRLRAALLGAVLLAPALASAWCIGRSCMETRDMGNTSSKTVLKLLSSCDDLLAAPTPERAITMSAAGIDDFIKRVGRVTHPTVMANYAYWEDLHGSGLKFDRQPKATAARTISTARQACTRLQQAFERAHAGS